MPRSIMQHALIYVSTPGLLSTHIPGIM